jgi:predicted site-specific integrase-resolvase
MKSNVIEIPAKPQAACAPNRAQRRRTAAYARVSTDSEEQETSFENQVSHYTKYIQNNPDWEFVEVYTEANFFLRTTFAPAA